MSLRPQESVGPAPPRVSAAPTQRIMPPFPRRPTSHNSVSLIHAARRRPQPPAKDKSESSSDGQGNTVGAKKKGSPSSLQPLGALSSGESSNAEKWFEKSNNEIQGNSTAFADNDPPFFMRNSSSSETPPDPRQHLALLNQQDGSSTLLTRTGLLHLGTDASSTEDFRSVIDDLTVENKKLKRRLKKFEKLHDSHLKDEKLFEVRIHGLPAEKKRELEDMLRKFSASLSSNGFAGKGYERLMPFLNTHQTSSSQTSLQNTDSAYASMSTSGRGSAAHIGNTEMQKPTQVAASRHQNIHSYLHQIPEGLLPQMNPATMSDRSKKKVVVRRMEQIFAGKGAVGGHQHPLQQQELSNIAARADQVANEAQGHPVIGEGSRVASFMPGGKTNPTDPINDKPEAKTAAYADDALVEQASSGTLAAGTATQTGQYEQRPTRPLDLDPHRAQVPADNIEYIRHLGFSPPELNRAPEEGHGWIYLNFLINMAQLHTINVTAEFVRKALTEYSSKFELSSDGRKVRWKGGNKPTMNGTSSSGGDSTLSRPGEETPDGQSPRKRRKTGTRSGSRHGSSSGLAARLAENKMVYTPLFFHKDSDEADADDNSSDEDDSSMSPLFAVPFAGDSSAMTSSGVRTISTKKHKNRDDGPIIFYNNARFCTDLSGERKPIGNTDAPPYALATKYPVGQPHDSTTPVYCERRVPLPNLDSMPEPSKVVGVASPGQNGLSFPEASRSPDIAEAKVEPAVMEATGIGGVRPADNFAIMVQTRFGLLDEDDDSNPPGLDKLNFVPPPISNLLRTYNSKKRSFPQYEQDILSIRKTDLAPSILPVPLSFMPFDEDSISDDGSEFDERMSEVPESPGALPPSAAPQPVDLHWSTSSSCATSEDEADDGGDDNAAAEDDDDDDDDDESDDGILDLLATARELDPEAIRAREIEYDANMAERLAEEIPAGSSAATAGGGSGYASPAGSVNREEYRRALMEARARGVVVGGRRARSGTAESPAVSGARASFEGRKESGSVADGDDMMSDIRS